MNNVGTLTSHSDFSGAGFGNCFTQFQKCKFEYLKSRLSQRGVNCLLRYNYQRSLAEACFTLTDQNGTHIADLKITERPQDFEDRNKPYVHYVYNYDVYVSSADGAWSRVGFSQRQENRVPYTKLNKSPPLFSLGYSQQINITSPNALLSSYLEQYLLGMGRLQHEHHLFD